jgi:hypothetical protein
MVEQLFNCSTFNNSFCIQIIIIAWSLAYSFFWGVTRRVSTRQSETPQQQHTTLQQNRRHSQRLSLRSSPFIEKVPNKNEGYNTPVPKVQVLNCLWMECYVAHCFVMRSYQCYVVLISEHIYTFLTSIIVKKIVLWYLCTQFEI